MVDARDLAAALRVLRRARGLTQQQLADAAAIPRRTYQRLEAGDPGVRIDSFLLALRALNLRVELTARRRPTIDQLQSVYGHDQDRGHPAPS